MGRLEKKWREPPKYSAVFTGENEEFMKIYKQALDKQKENGRSEAEAVGGAVSLIAQCEEIILNEGDIPGKKGFRLCLIMKVLNIETFAITVDHMMDILLEDDEDNEELKSQIALAMIYNVPVFGNTPELHDMVERLQSEIITNGFLLKSGNVKKRYIITAYNIDKNYYGGGIDIIKEISSERNLIPGEIKMIRDALSGVIGTAINIKKIETAINGLNSLLKPRSRDEREIRRFLIDNPILFGVEYKAIIPDHRLGAEYVMDYALETFNGVFDLVEIESSNLSIYNINGDPSSKLTHAEQQVMDWQEWIEKNNFYAAQGLKDIRSPKGFIIIGRRSRLNASLRLKLKRRNSSFANKIEILTYDDLIDKAKTLLMHLK